MEIGVIWAKKPSQLKCNHYKCSVNVQLGIYRCNQTVLFLTVCTKKCGFQWTTHASVTRQIYWYNIFEYCSILQYLSVFLVFFRSCPVHSLQVMMSTNLIYFIILCFSVILVVKCLFAMSNVKGWERKYSLLQG